MCEMCEGVRCVCGREGRGGLTLTIALKADVHEFSRSCTRS